MLHYYPRHAHLQEEKLYSHSIWYRRSGMLETCRG